jgi:hypothetical protein
VSLPMDADKMRRMEACAREIAGHLQKAFDMWRAMGHQEEKWGFALFIFSFGGAEMTYISNSNREDMVKMLLEFIAHAPPEKTWDEQHG